MATATYNERENLPELVERIHTALPAADVLVVDDNSPDGTGRWCREFAAEHAWFRCIERPGKLGLGTALVAIFQHAIDHQYELLATLDADLSHPPEKLPQLLAASPGYDVVIGSRYCRGGKIEGWGLRRLITSRLLNTFARLALRLPARDCSGNYRLYRVAALEKIDFGELRAGGYALIEEILWHLKRSGAPIVEVPITFVDRQAGDSKIAAGEAWGAVVTLVRLAWRGLWR